MADSALYAAIQWTKDQGEPKALDRLKVMCLPDFLDEGLSFAAIGPDTACSSETLGRVAAAASRIVGAPCPV